MRYVAREEASVAAAGRIRRGRDVVAAARCGEAVDARWQVLVAFAYEMPFATRAAMRTAAMPRFAVVDKDVTAMIAPTARVRRAAITRRALILTLRCRYSCHCHSARCCLPLLRCRRAFLPPLRYTIFRHFDFVDARADIFMRMLRHYFATFAAAA